MIKASLAALLVCATVTAIACDIPPLVQIPTDEEIDPRAAQRIRTEFTTYFEAMLAYTSCIQGELATAGGDAAPRLVKAAYVVRNNAAVAEFTAMQKVFEDTVVAAEAAQAPPARRAPDTGVRARD